MSNLSHLDALEAEAIYIMREVAAECEKPLCTKFLKALSKIIFLKIYNEGKI